MEYTVLHYERLSDRAKPPKRATPGSIGLDLFTPIDVFIPAKQQVLIPSNLILIPTLGYYIRIASKSGLAFKYGITVEGGVVDPDYRGNIGVLLRNNSNTGHTLEQGKAMAQVDNGEGCHARSGGDENRQGHPKRGWQIRLNHWVRSHR